MRSEVADWTNASSTPTTESKPRVEGGANAGAAGSKAGTLWTGDRSRGDPGRRGCVEARVPATVAFAWTSRWSNTRAWVCSLSARATCEV